MSVVGRERLAAGRQVVVARRGSAGARQRSGARSPRTPARLARHVARFPHRRSYNTPNTELFISSLGRTTEFGWVGRTDRRECARDQRVECLTSVGGGGAGTERHRERELSSNIQAGSTPLCFMQNLKAIPSYHELSSFKYMYTLRSLSKHGNTTKSVEVKSE